MAWHSGLTISFLFRLGVRQAGGLPTIELLDINHTTAPQVPKCHLFFHLLEAGFQDSDNLGV